MIVSKARLPLLMITSLVLLSASAGQTAPACKHVLRHLTQTEINATLDDLAELRMELDLEKANGQVKTTSKALERDYQEKQNQILTAMDMNLETLQKELQQRIQTLQSETKSESKTNPKSREAIEHGIKAAIPTYKLNRKIPNIGFSYIGLRALKFDDKTETLLFTKSGKLYTLDFHTRKSSTTDVDTNNFFVNQDQTTLFRLTANGLLSFVSLSDGTKLRNDVQLKIERPEKKSHRNPDFAPFAISPSGNKAALMLDNTLFIFDASTGDLIRRFENIDDRHPHLYFLKEDEIVASKKMEMMKFNLTTGLETTLSVYGSVSANVDANSIIIYDRNSLIDIAADTLEIRGRNKSFFSYANVTDVPGQPQFVVILGTKESNMNGIYDRKDMSDPVFDFNGHYLGVANTISHIYLTPDSKTALVFHNSGSEFHIDVWNRELQ